MTRLAWAALVLSICFTAREVSAQTPQIDLVWNAASYAQPVVLAPGVIFSAFGTSLTNGASASATETPLPTRLAGARLLVNGVAAPLFFASPRQINAQFPVELTGLTNTTLQVEVESATGMLSTPNPVQCSKAVLRFQLPKKGDYGWSPQESRRGWMLLLVRLVVAPCEIT